MNPRCEAIQARLAGEGRDALVGDTEAAQHVDGCHLCGSVAGALDLLEIALKQLGAIDAPDELVEATHAEVSRRVRDGIVEPSLGAVGFEDETEPRWRRWVGRVAAFVGRQPLVASGVAAVVVVASLVTFTTLQVTRVSAPERETTNYAMSPPNRETSSQKTPSEVGADSVQPAMAPPRPEALSNSPRRKVKRANKPAPASAPDALVLNSRSRDRSKLAASSRVGGKGQAVGGVSEVRTPPGRSKRAQEQIAQARLADEFQNEAVGLYSQNRSVDGKDARRRQEKKRISKQDGVRTLSESKFASEIAVVVDGDEARNAAVDSIHEVLELEGATTALRGLGYIAPSDFADDDGESLHGNLSQQFIQSRDWRPNLEFQSAAGYWENTYVPGDPAIRLLEGRLERFSERRLTLPDGSPLRADDASRRYRQPFDEPANSALAVYMHADRRDISGPSRFLVQVGLKGTARQSGLRPTMNVGVVLDLTRDVTADVSNGMRALVNAIAVAKQTGDRFSITVAGRPGGTVVAPAEWKHGLIRVQMGRVFGDQSELTGPALDLVSAVDLAMARVGQGDDPNAPLGASMVMVVTGTTISDSIGRLERMAHKSAVSGIPLTAVGVGGRIDLAEIDRLALAGQGNRRLLTAPEQAEQLIDRELHSASRAVARAVRLRIRLAPGVRLVEVIGSARLNDARADMTREAETSIDRRLARNLGIVADRGEDEEGIQIVIPSFSAGDSHVVLLDVAADNSGSIADVTVRYKDLVYLRNGVARANLSLTPGNRPPGRLELNVLKNMVAHQLSEAIRDAARRVEQGDDANAVATLEKEAELLLGLRAEIPGWSNDPELNNDSWMLEQYLHALKNGATSLPEGRELLSDSLEYAGHLKVQTKRR